MVEAITDRFQRKVFINVQGQDGNVTPFLSELENLGFYKRDDPKTKVIELLYPVTSKKAQFSTFSRAEVDIFDVEDEDVLVIFFFQGESYLVDGKIVAELGVGPIHLENRIDSFCKGASNVTIWAVWDCSRQIQQLEAGANKEEWPDDDEGGCVPVLSTYSCPIG